MSGATGGRQPGGPGGSTPPDLAALRDRLRDLRAARSELPPHSAQGWRPDLDDQIDALRRRIARVERDSDGA